MAQVVKIHREVIAVPRVESTTDTRLLLARQQIREIERFVFGAISAAPAPAYTERALLRMVTGLRRKLDEYRGVTHG